MALSALNATMRAVVYNAVPYQMSVENVPLPVIQNSTDALVRITTSAICGSDLHTYHGIQGDFTQYMGHEAVGYIAEIGDAVSSLAVGDYVIVPDIGASGHFQMEPTYATVGAIAGMQAEYVRVPYADDSLIPIPLTANTTNSTIEQDYMTVSDIFATAWRAIDWSGFEPGDTVAVFRAGPVGLLAAYSAIHRGASKVYSVDHVPMRLERAASIGAIPINFSESDPVEQILAYEPQGVIRSVDCVGYEAVNAQGNIEQDIVVRNMIAVTAPQGGMGQVGLWFETNGTEAQPMSNSISLPLSDFFVKNLGFRAGVVDPKPLARQLVDLISSGRASPHFITTSEISIEEAPEYYARFDEHEEIKVWIRFP